MTRLKLHVALLIALTALTAAATQAAERNDDPQWPNLAPNDLPSPPINPHPAFLNPDQVIARILDTPMPRAAANLDVDVTGSTARWPTFPVEEPVSLPLQQPLSPFAFETGARYWFSGGTIRFAFTNGNPLFGNPTSTLDWDGMAAHTGEVFARLDHRPSGVFVKGIFGMGSIRKGHIDDLDFLVTQFTFSDTTSKITGGNLTFAMADIGWAFWPAPDIRLGVFVGYHYWREKVTANGVLCNQASFIIATCASAGAVPVGFDVAVLAYEPTWHAVRLGVEGKVAFAERWSVNAEIAAVPYAVVQNKDSHLLRQSSADLGPAPNVITNSKYAFGVEAEVLINYALTPNIEIGGGLRYWGLMSRSGKVTFGPAFATPNEMTKFDQQRYGVLLQVKGKF